jgi:23S rRNA pseudouridine2605 synthase
MTEKIQKFLANLGLNSRRQIESMISEGRVTVDGELAHVGQRVEGTEDIRVDGQPIANEAQIQTKLLIYNKPEGLVCTRSDESGRPTVFEDLPPCDSGRWVMVGRLDINTTGLLLFTNDGELANQLMHPSRGLEREYAVRVYGKVDQTVLDRLIKGVYLDDGFANFESIKDAGGEGRNHWYRVVLKRGRNREVKRLWESQCMTVSRLIRIRYGSITLSNTLPVGKTRYATQAELQALLSSLRA